MVAQDHNDFGLALYSFDHKSHYYLDRLVDWFRVKKTNDLSTIVAAYSSHENSG